MRTDYLLHPQRPQAPLLDAATLLLVRDTSGTSDTSDTSGTSGTSGDAAPGTPGWQVLMTRRSAQASFVPGGYVFPGGGIEAQDSAEDAPVLTRPGMDAAERRAAVAALRETFEEMGLLLAVHADGRPATQADVQALNRHAPLWPQLRAQGLQLDARGLWLLAHWTADPVVPKRFAVPFFVALAPAGQTPVADESEQFEPVWVQPQQALTQHKTGQMPMIYPTIRTLERLVAYPNSAALLAAVADGPLWRSMPRSGRLAGKEFRCMEDEAAYGELALVCPDGQGLHHVDWDCTQARPLRKNLLRLTAPNASVMTGPGTNSYLVGEAATGFIAIDPGPDDGAHIQRLYDAAGGDIRHIVCSHSHPDHAPGAWLLQALCVKNGQPKPLVYGLPSGPGALPSSQFQPDKILQNKELLALTGQGLEAENTQKITHTLQAIHTPGHTENHLCLLLVEDALLFTGDHILNGSTTIINPPDGNMQDYLDSLALLDTLCTAHAVEFLLPAHGYVLGRARQVIAHLTTHRLAREAKVLAALQAQPQGTVQDWVAMAYADTPPALWPLAQRSLQAHLERIHALGLSDVGKTPS